MSGVQTTASYPEEILVDRQDSRPLSDTSYTGFGWVLFKSKVTIPEKQRLVLAECAVAGWQSRCPGGTRTGAEPDLLRLCGKEFGALG